MLRWHELLNLFPLVELTKNCISIHLCYGYRKKYFLFDMYGEHIFPEDLRTNV